MGCLPQTRSAAIYGAEKLAFIQSNGESPMRGGERGFKGLISKSMLIPGFSYKTISLEKQGARASSCSLFLFLSLEPSCFARVPLGCVKSLVLFP